MPLAIGAVAGGYAFDPAKLALAWLFWLPIILFFSLPFIVVLGIPGGLYLASDPRGSMAATIGTTLLFALIAAIPLGVGGLAIARMEHLHDRRRFR